MEACDIPVKGMKFEKYEDFEIFKKNYEQNCRQKFNKISSRFSNKSNIVKEYNPKLVFSDIVYECTFGKLRHKSTSTGERAARYDMLYYIQQCIDII